MRRFVRPVLDPAVRPYYLKWTRSITRKRTARGRSVEAHRLWKQVRSTRVMEAVVAQLRVMNAHLTMCMYCEHDRATACKNGKWRAIIEHWEPIAEAPHRAFDWKNHFLSCHRCNSLLKGRDFPRDPSGQPLLIHPVDDNPALHLRFVPSNGEFKPQNNSEKGDTTIQFFQLWEFDKSRRGVWDALVKGLRAFHEAHLRGDVLVADAIRRDILGHDHRSLLGYLVEIARGPSGDLLTAPDIPGIVALHGVDAWT